MRITIKDSNVLITGAGSGLGAEIAREMALKGAKSLILVSRKREKLNDISKELEAKYPKLEVFTQSCDLADSKAVEAMANSILSQHQVDVLVNNAGQGDLAFFDQSKIEKNIKMIQVNVIGLTVLTHKVLPSMIKRKKGAILNVGSGASSFRVPCAAVYNATKSFVDAFTQSLEIDLAGTGVFVGQICPGPIQDGSKSKSPPVISISTKQCAKEAVKGLELQNTKILPGTIYRLTSWCLSWIPSIVINNVAKMISWKIRNSN
eukprot:TRINITY_DN4570_c0_g1_i1.p1 TRINITY_DN4570_c0_g1~~TRINITY_DN4570_c0_g1_i1.p1  ORF type:complete len:262 (-),score=76.55 TRINITY_DN4570_c0_g1_i1:30-815(-)